MLAEAASVYKAQGKTLVDVLEDLYKQHGTYEESQVAVELEGEAGAKRIQQILADLRTNGLDEIAGEKVVRFEDYNDAVIKENGETKPLEGFTKSDVLKYYLEDGSWIAVRPSGTEPKCKFYYCVKGTDHADAKAKTATFQKAMAEITGTDK